MSVTRQVVGTADIAIVTTTELVVCTLAGVAQNFDGGQILLEGWVQVTTGTNTTALTIRCRRGTLITDTLVGEANAEQIFSAAGNTESRSIMVVDTPAAGAAYNYVLTIQQTAASANGSALQSCLAASVLDPHGT